MKIETAFLREEPRMMQSDVVIVAGRCESCDFRWEWPEGTLLLASSSSDIRSNGRICKLCGGQLLLSTVVLHED